MNRLPLVASFIGRPALCAAVLLTLACTPACTRYVQVVTDRPCTYAVRYDTPGHPDLWREVGGASPGMPGTIRAHRIYAGDLFVLGVDEEERAVCISHPDGDTAVLGDWRAATAAEWQAATEPGIKVARGWTRDEVEFSMGPPREIEQNGGTETWLYLGGEVQFDAAGVQSWWFRDGGPVITPMPVIVPLVVP